MAKYMSEEELEKMRKSMGGTGLYLNIKSGESLTFSVVGDTFYECFKGEPNVMGHVAKYDGLQLEVEVDGDSGKVLTVQRMLAKCMLDELETNGMKLSDLKGKTFIVKRNDTYEWDVKLISDEKQNGITGDIDMDIVATLTENKDGLSVLELQFQLSEKGHEKMESYRAIMNMLKHGMIKKSGDSLVLA